MTFEFPISAAASSLVGVALLIAACSRPGSTTGSSALKPIDQAALQTMVDTTAKELLIPGAVVLLAHAPGRVHGHLRHHATRRHEPTPRRHPLPDRLEYQDDDGRGDRAARPGRQAQSRRSGLEVRPGRAQRRQDHHRRTAEDAQRPLQLHRRPRVLRRASTVTRPGSGPQPKCWRSRSSTRPTSHPVRPSTTPTPTTRCSASSPKRSTGSRWPVVSRTVCSGRWA